MLLTIIPFLLVFGWLNASFSFVPLVQDDTFTVMADVKGVEMVSLVILPSDKVTINSSNSTVVDGIASWQVTGQTGEYTMKFSSGSEVVEQDLLIGETYATPVVKHDSSVFKSTSIKNEKVKVHIFKWDIGWFWAYILFSLIFSLALRKLLKIY
jgi:uncharacterized membrane protein (DUF106 family)